MTDRVLRHSSKPVLAVPVPDHEQVFFSPEGPRFTFGHVLAPIDFGERSLADARVAHELALGFEIPLLLVHVVTTIRATDRWNQSLEAHERIALAHAREGLARLARELGGNSISTHVAVGFRPTRSPRSQRSATQD